MSRQSSLKLLIVLALAAAGLALFLPRREDRVVSSAHEPVPERTADAPATLEAPLLASSPPVANEQRAPDRTAAVQQVDELDDAFWVEGRIVLPDGVPADERVEIVANGNPATARGPHRVRPHADGSFRVAFAKGTTAGLLTLDARYLYLEKEPAIYAENPPKDLVLEPKLGGVVRGRVVLGSNAASMREAVRGASVRASGNVEGVFTEPAAVERSSRISDDLRFEVPGLPPAFLYRVGVHVDGFATLVRNGLTVEPGQVVDLELEVLSGATIRGRVVDETGAALAGVRVVCFTKTTRNIMGPTPSTTSGPDGAFELSAVYPGVAALHADAEGMNSARLELGEITDGEIRPGALLVLSRCLPIAGRVQWPDGTPAAGCTVAYTYRFTIAKSVSFGEKKVVCGPDGSFKIVEVGDGNLGLTARSRAPAEDARATPGWVAHLDDVQPGTEGVVLVLRPGAILQVRILDELGEPVANATVTACRVRPDWPEGARQGAVPGTFHRESGRFEIPGLYEGEWSLRAEAPGYAKSTDLTVAVPGDGAPIDIVLQRNSTLSGEVVDDSNRPVANARVSVGLGQGDPLEYRFKVGAGSGGGRSDADGRFELVSVPPGHVMLRAEAEGGSLVASLVLDLEPGESRSGLKLVVVSAGDPSPK